MFELHFCWKWNFHSSQNSLRADFRAVLISFSLSSVHFWIMLILLILGELDVPTYVDYVYFADSWWIGCSHICWLCWFCWFFMNWMFPHMLIMLIMLILDWLNGSSVQSRVPLLFCISTTPALIWTQNQTLANSIGVKSYPQRTLLQQNCLWIISLFFANGCCKRILPF